MDTEPKPELLCKFTVPGRPSRKPRPGQSRTGHRIPDTKAMALQKAISKIARAAYTGQPHVGPVIVVKRYIFAIPVSWPRSLKIAALAGRVPHISDPDIDQLDKQVMDALTGIVYKDDNQVCGHGATGKRYGGPERTEVEVWALPQDPAEITPGQKRLEREKLASAQEALFAPRIKRHSRND